MNRTVRLVRSWPSVVLFDGKGPAVASITPRRVEPREPPERRTENLGIEPDPPRRRTEKRVASRRLPDPETPDPPPVKKGPTTIGKGPIQPAFWLGVGARFFTRTLYYNDDIFGELSPYNLPMAPALALSLEWFPGAHFTDGFGAHIGIVADFAYALGLGSRTPDGTQLTTTAFNLDIGLRGRIPLGPLAIFLTVGYGLKSFNIDTSTATNTLGFEVPGVDYHTLRIIASVYWALHPRVSLFAGGGYRVLLGSGQLGSDEYFPRTSGGAAEAEAGIDIKILTWLSLRARFQFNHFFFSFNPEPSDRRVAGGAVDQYANIDANVVFTF